MTPAQALAATLDARLYPNNGDPRIVTPTGDLIYADPRGRVKVDHRGRIHTLGTWSDPTETLAAVYRSIVGAGVGA